MTMNNSKKYRIVLLINIGLLVFFIFSCYLYNHRQVLMDTTFYYEIPVIDKVLTINTPVFNDYATNNNTYVYHDDFGKLHFVDHLPYCIIHVLVQNHIRQNNPNIHRWCSWS